MLKKSQLDRIREICGHLDVDCYGKDCNFIQDEDELIFYSRDFCHEITFRELLKWYLPNYHYSDIEEDDAGWNKCIEAKTDMMLELIDLYAQYKMVKKING